MKDRNSPKRVSTSIKINPDLWKRARIEAIKKDTTISDIVEELIRKWLEGEENEEE